MAAACPWVCLGERTSLVLNSPPSGNTCLGLGDAEVAGVLLLFEEHKVYVCVVGRPALRPCVHYSD